MTNSNWAGNITFSDAQTFHPKSEAELQKIVKANPRIRTRGSAHCFNTIADTNATAVLLDQIPHNFTIDRDRMTVAANGGAKYGELATFLENEGFALHNLASLPHISIAGAVATGTHGSGINNGGLHTAVRSIEVMNTDGDLEKFTPEHDIFYAATVGLGVFGVIARIEVAIEPTYEVAQSVYQSLSRELIAENYLEIMSSGYSVSFFTTWSSDGVGDLWQKVRHPQLPTPQYFGANAATTKLHPIPGIDAIHCTEQLGVFGAWHHRLPHFKMEFTPSSGDELQSEFFVSVDDAPAVFAALETIAPEINKLLLVSEFRTVKADDFWLSGSYQRDTAAFHFTWQKQTAVYQLLPKIEALLQPFHYRPHLGKVFSATPEYLASVFPRWKDFVTMVGKVDPAGKFSNEFTRNLLGLN